MAAATAIGMLGALAAACTSTDDSDADDSAHSGDAVVVFAATSLTDVFTQLAADFESEHGVEVELTFDGSSALAQQVLDGETADVAAFDTPEPLDSLDEAGHVDAESSVFARNHPVLVTPLDNPAEVTDLEDLASEDLQVALCLAEEPCGVVAHETAAAAGVEPAPDMEEADELSVLEAVASGEADVGVVYATDATEDVEVLEIPKATVTDYPIVELTGASAHAVAWVEFVEGDAGQDALSEAGFIVE